MPETRYAFRVRVAAAGERRASAWSRPVDIKTERGQEVVMSPVPKVSPSKNVMARAASEFMRRMEAGKGKLFPSPPDGGPRRRPLQTSQSVNRVAKVSPEPQKPKARPPQHAHPGGWRGAGADIRLEPLPNARRDRTLPDARRGLTRSSTRAEEASPRRAPRPDSRYELRDENGSAYYWNAESDVSQWEPPTKWAQEVDPVSGVSYYTDGLHSTWRKPQDFVDVAKPITNPNKRNVDTFAKQTFKARPPRC